MKVTIIDESGEGNKVALKWTLSATFDKEFLDLELSNKDETRGLEIIQIVREKFLTQGVDGGKIKEAWTVFDVTTPARKIAQQISAK